MKLITSPLQAKEEFCVYTRGRENSTLCRSKPFYVLFCCFQSVLHAIPLFPSCFTYFCVVSKLVYILFRCFQAVLHTFPLFPSCFTCYSVVSKLFHLLFCCFQVGLHTFRCFKAVLHTFPLFSSCFTKSCFKYSICSSNAVQFQHLSEQMLSS